MMEIRKKNRGRLLLFFTVLFSFFIVVLLTSISMLREKNKESDFVITAQLKRPINQNEILISLTNKGFIPKAVSINQQDKKKAIIFRNVDTKKHKITSTYPNFDAPEIGSGSEYTFVFFLAGKWSVSYESDSEKSMSIVVK